MGSEEQFWLASIDQLTSLLLALHSSGYNKENSDLCKLIEDTLYSLVEMVDHRVILSREFVMENEKVMGKA